MALPGKNPETVKKRLKLFMYGPAGVGKTTVCTNFPNVFYVDTEGGTQNNQYIQQLTANSSRYYATSDFVDIIGALDSLMREKHPYKTIVIDPLTTVYNDMLNVAEKLVGNEFGRHYAEANKKIKHLMNLLIRIDMNVIITSHSKNEYGDKLQVLGQTFDCYKKLDYLFDLVIELRRAGKRIIGYVRKSRIESFEQEGSFDFNYAELSKRYGADIMEKEAVLEDFATKESVDEINRLIELLKVDPALRQKWLTKAKAMSFEDMTEETIQKCITYLNRQVEGK